MDLVARTRKYLVCQNLYLDDYRAKEARYAYYWLLEEGNSEKLLRGDDDVPKTVRVAATYMKNGGRKLVFPDFITG